MSLLNLNEIDGLLPATNEETGERILGLFMLDNFDWYDEKAKEGKALNAKHLQMFKEKLNSYLMYIQRKEYAEKDLPNEQFDAFVLDIVFAHKPDEKIERRLDEYLEQVDAFKHKINLDYAIRYGRPGPYDKVGQALEFCLRGSKIIVEWDEWATALCEVAGRTVNPKAEEQNDVYLKTIVEVKKVFRSTKDSGITKGVKVKISGKDRPSAIYTEAGKLLWKEEN